MYLRKITQVSFESFKSATRGKKVVLLYPWSNFRNVFLSYYLQDLLDGLLYYRIPEGRECLRDWLGGLLEELRFADAGFGCGLTAALEGGSAAQLGEALARDLGSFDDDRVVLYLDEVDRLEPDADFQNCIRALTDALPSHAQLAVNSRLLTGKPWAEYLADGSAVVIGASPRNGRLAFARETRLKPQLEVLAFGPGRVFCEGREIENWDGALPRNLFYYFMDNAPISRQQAFDVFWQKLSKKDATNVFHVTKRKITERISAQVEDGANYELTAYVSGFYVPSGKLARHYDVADFENAVDGAAAADSARERESLYRQAVEIYKAPFLQDSRLPWVEARRAQLQARYTEALVGLGDLQALRDDWQWALGSYIRAAKEAPLREDIHRKAMRMYLKLARPDDARLHFEAFERNLKHELGIAPSGSTLDLLRSMPA